MITIMLCEQSSLNNFTTNEPENSLSFRLKHLKISCLAITTGLWEYWYNWTPKQNYVKRIYWYSPKAYFVLVKTSKHSSFCIKTSAKLPTKNIAQFLQESNSLQAECTLDLPVALWQLQWWNGSQRGLETILQHKRSLTQCMSCLMQHNKRDHISPQTGINASKSVATKAYWSASKLSSHCASLEQGRWLISTTLILQHHSKG